MECMTQEFQISCSGCISQWVYLWMKLLSLMSSAGSIAIILRFCSDASIYSITEFSVLAFRQIGRPTIFLSEASLSNIGLGEQETMVLNTENRPCKASRIITYPNLLVLGIECDRCIDIDNTFILLHFQRNYTEGAHQSLYRAMRHSRTP